MSTLDVVDRRKKGFSIIDDELLDKVQTSVYVKMTYVVIARHADKEGISFPSTETIATKGGMSVAQVKRSLPELEARMMIRVERSNGRPNKYYLLDKSLWIDPVTKLSQIPVADNQALPDTGSSPDPALADTGSDVTKLSQIPVPSSPRAWKEYTLKEEDTHTNETADVCECFLTKYPQKKRQAQARQEWASLNPGELLIREIMAGLDAELASDMWRRGVGIPYPDRYLRERMWKDTAKEVPIQETTKADSGKSPVVWVPHKDGTWSRTENGIEMIIAEKDVSPDILAKHGRGKEAKPLHHIDPLSFLGKTIPLTNTERRRPEHGRL